MKLFKPNFISMFKIKMIFIVAMALLGGMTAAADPLLANAPLFLVGNVKPNIYFVVDDSGSMGRSTLFSDGAETIWGLKNVGNAWKHLMDIPPIYHDQDWFVDPRGSGTWPVDERQEILKYCRGVNVIHYDPSVTYTPWDGVNSTDGKYVDQVDPAKALTSPYNSTGTVDLFRTNVVTTGNKRNQTIVGTEKIGYMPWNDLNLDNKVNLNVDIDKSSSIEVFLDQDNDNIFDGFVDLNGNGVPDGWVDLNGNGSYDVGELEIESEMECPDLQQLLDAGYSEKEAGDFLDKWLISVDEMSDAEQKNYSNWYSYYRIRTYIAKRALSKIIMDSTARVGLNTLQQKKKLEIKNIDDITITASTTDKEANAKNKAALMDAMFEIPTNGGTPLRSALNRAGQYFSGSYSSYASPILSKDEGGSCQQNFTILITDGYWKDDSGFLLKDSDGEAIEADSDNDTIWDGPADKNIDNFNFADLSPNPPESTLSDVAMHYYETDLSNLDDKVPANAYDQNTAQHMVTYTVAFGVTGDLHEEYLKYDGIDSPEEYLQSEYFKGWPTPKSDTKSTIDDVWHAALNGRGLFLNAQNPDEFITSLNEAIGNIEERNASASAVSINSGSITTSSMLFSASFNSEFWIGRLYGTPINKNGTLDEANRVVASIIPNEANRNIITWNTQTTLGVPFQWDQISASSQQSLFSPGDQDLLDYIRGDATLEGTTLDGITYRERADWKSNGTKNHLGDIVNSAPVYVANPQYLYSDSIEEAASYSAFRKNPDNDTTNDFNNNGLPYYRKPMLYVGANDGMLHGFNIDPRPINVDGFGQEVFAYVPSMLFKNFKNLADATYNHAYFVDGSPYVGDAYFNSAWHTVLVGGLNAGGQGIYALDITNPEAFSGTETTAAKNVLWEFSDSDDIADDGIIDGDKDLGYTYSKPIVVKSNTGKWVAIFGNGYNNTDSDAAIGNGTAVLYIVDLATGNLIRKIDTGVSMSSASNGLSSPATIDTNGDYKADYVYAGDVAGNLWKFNISSTDSTKWDVAYKKSDGSAQPLFTATDCTGTCDPINRQPITVKPTVSFNKAKTGYLVYFGTGSYYTSTDNESTGLQTFYAIWDKNETTLTPFDRSHLLQQKITKEISPTTENGLVDKQRVTSNNTIIWHTDTGLPADGDDEDDDVDTHLGWYMDLYNTEGGNTTGSGERVVAEAQLRDNSVIFVTVTPDLDVCSAGGVSWYMEVSANSGSRHSTPVIDVNGDGVVDEADYLSTGEASSGRSSVDNYLMSTPVCIALEDGSESCYSNTSNATVTTIQRDSGLNYGRWMWREL